MIEPLILNLDDGRALDPAVVGSKVATLARARAAGLPVLDGFAITVAAAATAVRIGMEALQARNSGFARSRIIGAAVDPGLRDAAVEAAGRLGPALVVRSSAVVEGEGVWAGAFSSYAELAPDEVVTGIVGCWSSMFTPGALERAEGVGLGPGEIGMAVLMQPEIQPSFGGVATVGAGGSVTIIGIQGAPAAIVSGWERGEVVVVDEEGASPEASVAALGAERVTAVAELARTTAAVLDCGHIEWAEAAGKLWLLQAQAAPPPRPNPLPRPQPADDERAGDPGELVARIAEEVRNRDAAGRVAMPQWEPQLFQVVAARGTESVGEPAAAGWGAGRVRFIRDAADAERFQPREVVAAVYPLNNLAPLLWSAAGVVTIGGSPGAHLFEVASWLGIPAVCGVDVEGVTGMTRDQLAGSTDLVAAVDGDVGTVTVLDVTS